MDNSQNTQENNHLPGSVIQPSPAGAQPSVEPAPSAQPMPAQTKVTAAAPLPSPPEQAAVYPAAPNTEMGAAAPQTGPETPKRKFGLPMPKLAGKKMAVAAGLAILLIGAAVYTFAFYIPNTPQNLWGTSLSRMGKGYDKLSSYIQNYNAPKGYKIDGNLNLSGSFAADGTITAASDGSNGQATLKVSAAGLNLTLDSLSIKSTGSVPDLYVKVSGLDQAAPLVDDFAPGLGSSLSSINNQWYLIDHTLFEQAAGSNFSISKSDVSQLVNATAAPTKQYVFTNNSKNMAFVIKQKIGREKQDGRNVYHYKIGINSANLAAYEKALCTNVSSTKLGKLFEGSALDSSVKVNPQDCSSISADAQNGRTADVWVDTHTKLIHRVRFTDPSESSNYLDVLQDYQGGSSFPFGVAVNSKDSGDTMTGLVNFVLDTKANTLSVKASFNASGSSSEKGDLSLTMGPNTAAVNVQKPANAQNVLQLLGPLESSLTAN